MTCHCIPGIMGRMEPESAVVLSRAGNCAVVQLPGRAFPGVHVQGDTFRLLQGQVAWAARTLRQDPGNDEALDELDDAVQRMAAFIAVDEEALSERGMRLPY
jgi:hypothetical protein